jgi:hydroxymethylbilane synthase
VAGYARVENGALTVLGLVGRPDGSELISDRTSGSAGDAGKLGSALADALLQRGAAVILAASA